MVQVQAPVPVPVRVGLRRRVQPPARATQLAAFLGARRHPPQVLHQWLAHCLMRLSRQHQAA